MIINVCMFCRKELFRDEEEQIVCSDHPDTVSFDKIHVEEEQKNAI